MQRFEYQKNYRAVHREQMIDYSRNYWKENRESLLIQKREYRKANIVEIRRKQRIRNLAAIDEFLQMKSLCGCADCGMTEGICLDFHHINPVEKKFKLTWTSYISKPLDELLDEIAKCEILCANCHRKETHRIRRI